MPPISGSADHIQAPQEEEDVAKTIITTHKNTDFDALASVVAATILYPDALTVLPAVLNPNVRAFISLHKDLFEFCQPDIFDLADVDRMVVVDTSSWMRLDRLEALKEKKDLDIHMYDHHEERGDLQAAWECREAAGANITLMIRFLKQRRVSITPLQANIFLTGLYEDTGNLTFPATTAEDAHAAAYFLEQGANLSVVSAFLSPVYRQKQKDTLFRMLQDAERSQINGTSVSIVRLTMDEYVENLSVVIQMYRRILNVDAVFGIFELSHDRILVIGRSDKDLFHPVKAFMRTRVITIDPGKTPAQAAQLMVKHDIGRLPVIEKGRLAGIISRSDVMYDLYGFCPVERQLTKGCRQTIQLSSITGDKLVQ
jgi:nanoRNase/pAp phosphatase (c-di-AMP/oligoRNAs hydrolase)